MFWWGISAFIICTWVISLCKVLYFSSSPREGDMLLTGGHKQCESKRNVLLVVAHPDDESMFFSPTLLFLTTKNDNVHILCLSTGNADGKGDIRKEEIFRACVILKVPLQNITVLEDSQLQDGFANPWDHQYLACIIGDHIKKKNVDLVITFDNYGVSGHRNHCDVHLGICEYLATNSKKNIEAWELVSISIFRKYGGPLEIWSSILYGMLSGKGQTCYVVNRHPQKSYLAMAEHDSQWIWFRKLFVLFSSYTYVNTLRRISR